MMHPQSTESDSQRTPFKYLPEDTCRTRERGSSSSIASKGSLLIDEVSAKLRDIPSLDVEHGSPIILEYCTQDMLDSLEDCFREAGLPVPRMRVESNKLCLEECSISVEHGVISGAFNSCVAEYNISISGTSRDPLRDEDSASYDLALGSVQPDRRYQVRSTPRRNCPNMVVEVATSQSLEDLHHKCLRYLNESTNVLVVIAVKLYPAEHFVDRVMLAMMYFRNTDNRPVLAPTTAVSFGPAAMPLMLADTVMQVAHASGISGFVQGRDSMIPCDRAGIDEYLLTISHHLLLAINDEGGLVAPHHFDASDLIIDLFHIQQSIL